MSRILCTVRNYSARATPTPSSTYIAAEARRKWRLTDTPSPRSILNDDDTPLPPSLSLSSKSATTEEDEESLLSPRSNTPLHLRQPPTKPTPSEWKSHRHALRDSFPQGWSPPRKISRDAMYGLRELHKMDPERFTTPVLAERFKISPEAVRRILKSKWEPSTERKLKWVEKERQARNDRFERKKMQLKQEQEEMKEILLARQFSGGLTLKG